MRMPKSFVTVITVAVAGLAATPALADPPATTGLLVHIDGIAPTLDGMEKQFASVGAPSMPASMVWPMAAQQLGFKTGSSIDLNKPAGLIVDAGAGMMMGGVPKGAFWLATTSDAALKADLKPSASGTGFAPPAQLAMFIQDVEAVPGGVIFGTDAAYVAQVKSFIQSDLGTLNPAGGIQITLDMDHLAAQLGPVLSARMGSLGGQQAASIQQVIAWMQEVDSAVLTYRPDPSVLKLTIDAIPVAGSHFATVASSKSVAAPDGALLPSNFPVQMTIGIGADAMQALTQLATAKVTDPTLLAADKDLMSNMTGQMSWGMDFTGPTDYELVGQTSYNDSAKAQTALRQVSTKLGAFGLPMPAGMSVDLKQSAATVGGVSADELTMTLPLGKQYEYVACPPGSCVTAMAPQEAKSSALLGQVLGAKGTPLIARPGVKETAAMLGDVSHGLAYVDLEQIVARVAAQKKGGDPSTIGSSGKPGLGIGWNSDGKKISLTMAMAVSELVDLKGMAPSMGPSDDE
jgi:hypothetical protein